MGSEMCIRDSLEVLLTIATTGDGVQRRCSDSATRRQFETLVQLLADKTTTDKTTTDKGFNDLGPVALPRIGKEERFSPPCPRHRQAGRRAGPHQYLSKPFHCGCCVGTCELCDPTKDLWSLSYAMLE